MKQSCGKCKYCRIMWKSRMSNYRDAVCTWIRHAQIKLPTAIVIDVCPRTTEKSGGTCKTFIAKAGKQ